MKQSNIEVGIVNLTKEKTPLSKAFFNDIAKQTLRFVGFEAHDKKLSVNLAFVTEARIREINKTWRGENKVTDVLSFSIMDIPQGKLAIRIKMKNAQKDKFLFDNENQIVICLSAAKKQAIKLGLTQRQNLARLFSHGILHILGYDHERSKEEDEITNELQMTMIKKFK